MSTNIFGDLSNQSVKLSEAEFKKPKDDFSSSSCECYRLKFTFGMRHDVALVILSGLEVERTSPQELSALRSSGLFLLHPAKRQSSIVIFRAVRLMVNNADSFLHGSCSDLCVWLCRAVRHMQSSGDFRQVPARFDVEAIILVALLLRQTKRPGECNHRTVISTKFQIGIKHFATTLADILIQAVAQ